MIISKDKLESLYNAAEDKMPYFKRNTYEQAFRKYYGECLPLYDEIENLTKEKSEDEVQKIIDDISTDFTSIFIDEYNSITKKGLKRTYVTNHNSPLVIFVFPGILEYKGEWSNPLCEGIVSKWNKAFTNLTLGYGTFEEIKGGFKTSLCYITTAVCLSQGKDDTCEELMLLRGYRDNILINEPGGRLLIDEYYDIAPTIVKRINRSAAPDAVYYSIYERYISKCAEFIKMNQYDLCKNTYISMVNELKAEYA